MNPLRNSEEKIGISSIEKMSSGECQRSAGKRLVHTEFGWVDEEETTVAQGAGAQTNWLL